MAVCVLCNKNEVPNGFRVCNECFDMLEAKPKVYLRLVDSDSMQQGVVFWEHNAIGGEPYDKEPEPVGIWGKYGEPAQYWVSLCKPIEALHDMLTQLYLRIDKRNREIVSSYQSKSERRRADRVSTPPTQAPAEPSSVPKAFDNLRAKLRRLGI